MTDSDLILGYLERFPGFQNAADMMRALKPGAVGWAMRSRISDLNKKLPKEGLFIEGRIAKNGMAEYRLVKLDSDGAGRHPTCVPTPSTPLSPVDGQLLMFEEVA